MVDPLNQQAKSLQDQLEIFEGLIKADLPDPATIYLGDGYFASVPLKHAHDFLHRKIQSLERELNSLKELAGMNDEGLPILEIVEELDDDGKVIGSTVNRTGLGAQLENLRLKKDRGDESKTSTENGPQPVTNTTDENVKVERDSAISGRPDAHPDAVHTPGTVIHSSNDNDIQYIEDISSVDGLGDRDLEDKSGGDYRDIDASEILELHLSDDSDDDPVDFDFDNLEEEEEEEADMMFVENDSEDDEDDEDDDDDGDDDNSAWISRSGSLFPQDDATRKLIEAHLAQQSTPPDSQDAKISKKSEKTTRVHFSDKVDVCEFETTSSERKLTIADTMARKPSRFKSIRQNSQSSAMKAAVSASNMQTNPTRKMGVSAAAAAAAAVVGKSPPRSAHGAVREREAPIPKPLAKHSPATSSMKHVNSPRASNAASDPVNKVAAAKHTPQIDSEETHKGPHRDETSALSSQNLHKDQKEESKKYGIGSISKSADNSSPEHSAKPSSHSNLKSKISSDAEKIYQNSFVPDDEFLKLHEGALCESEPKNDEKDSKVDTTDHRPILSSVMERPVSEYEEASEDENAVDMKEVKKEYQRLRQQLIYGSGGFKKQEDEKAIEPISSDGEPKKISRFKAARIR